MITLASLLLAVALPHGPLFGAGDLDAHVDRVLAYKNGVSLVSVRLEGRADSAGGLRYVLPPAAMIVGGLWLEGEQAPLAVRAATREEDALRPVEGIAELLEANIGSTASIAWLPRGVTAVPTNGLPSVLGTITRLLAPTQKVPFDRFEGHVEPTYVVLTSATSPRITVGVVSIADIVSVNGEGLRTEIVRPVVSEWALEFETEPGANFGCELHFLARGVSWRAIHRLDGDLVGEDELSLSIELSNDLMDFAGTAVHVVAGEPNFRYADLASALSAPATAPTAALTARSSAPAWGQQLGNLFSNNSVYAERAEPASQSESTLPGSADGDLTRIAIGSIDLARGGRSLRRVREQQVPVSHLYTLDLDVRRGSQNGVEVRDARGSGDNWEPAYKGGFVRARRSKVWHQLVLQNTGNVPWTHGPLLVVKREADGPFPLAQEDLRYTAIGGTSEVPLNLALGVETEFDEQAHSDGKTVDGVLTVTNRIGERIDLRVRIGVGGRVSIIDGKAETFESPGRDEDWTGDERNWWRWKRASNPHTQIEWPIALEPGAAATLRYIATYDIERR